MEQPKLITVEKKQTREFVGKAWKHTMRDGSGEVVNLSFDNNIEVQITNKATGKAYKLAPGVSLTGFPNPKRDGKRDADLRFSFALPTSTA